MTVRRRLDEILDTRSKVRIIRLFVSRREDFMASGRGVAKLVGITPPAAHTALKELYNQNILRRDLVGAQHIYRINHSSRIVKEMLQPMFRKEISVKDDIAKFLAEKIKKHKMRNLLESAVLYGSIAKGVAHSKSDCDIAIIVNDSRSKKKVEDVFRDEISSEFYEYFGLHLDLYTKTHDEFMTRLKRNLPPVSELMNSYIVIYGADPIGYR